MRNATIPEGWLLRFEREARERIAQCRTRAIAEPKGLDFSSNDYLGLRRDPRMAEAAALASRQFGTGVGASRLLRGTTPIHEELEQALAQWKGTETCLLFNSGFQCNVTLIPSLLQPGDAVFSDALNHASIVDGCRLARGRGTHLGIYHHLDLADLQQRVSTWRRGATEDALALVATDAVFSMDGDAADLPGLLEICAKHQAILMVDEAHTTGLLGETGAGLAEQQGVKGQIPLLMGTLGKGLGTFGAFLGCDPMMKDHLVNTCRGFIYSTALPPPVVGAALEGVRIAQSEPWRREKALGHARHIREALGLPHFPSAIVPILAGSDARALAWAHRLQDQGFDVRAVRPPTVPVGKALLRVTTGAHLEDAQVETLVYALQELP